MHSQALNPDPYLVLFWTLEQLNEGLSQNDDQKKFPDFTPS